MRGFRLGHAGIMRVCVRARCRTTSNLLVAVPSPGAPAPGILCMFSTGSSHKRNAGVLSAARPYRIRVGAALWRWMARVACSCAVATRPAPSGRSQLKVQARLVRSSAQADM